MKMISIISVMYAYCFTDIQHIIIRYTIFHTSTKIIILQKTAKLFFQQRVKKKTPQKCDVTWRKGGDCILPVQSNFALMCINHISLQVT